MMTGRPTYNLPSAHRLRGPFDTAAFTQSLQEIVHPAGSDDDFVEIEEGETE